MEREPHDNQVCLKDGEEVSLLDSELQRLFDDVRQQAQKCRKINLRLILTTSATTFAISIILSLLCHFDYGGTVLVTFISLPLLLISLLMPQWIAKRRQKQATERLIELQDLRSVGPLADVLSFNDAHCRGLARQALLRLLPRLKATDANLLNAQHRDNLRIILKGQDTALILTLLAAYQQIGDERDLVAVQNLIAGYPWKKSRIAEADKPRLYQAALDCLPFLQENTQQNRIRQTLLRASDPSALASDELVRPAITNEATDSQQLLRSAPDSGP